jgi:site-specific DNA-methyltransferase (adenine-specific)
VTPYYDEDGITIYHGESAAVMASLPEASCDVLLTDPPYSSGGMFRSDRAVDPAGKYRGWSHTDTSTRKPASEYGTFSGDSRDQRSWLVWVSAWAWAALRLTKPGGHSFMFTDWRQLPAATDALQLGGWTWRGVLVWDKGVGRPMQGRFRNHIEFIGWGTNGPIDEVEGVYPSALIQVPTVHSGERQHVTQKPVELLRHLLTVVPGSAPLTALDPFMGAGSTLVAAKYAGHKAIGIEVEERYCEIAAKRLSQGVLDFEGVA